MSVTPERHGPSGLLIAAVAAGVAVALALILVLATVSTDAGSGHDVLVGRRLAPFHLAALRGGEVAAPWSTGHPTVVVFFASWCRPCRTELPRVAAYLARHPLGAVRVLGVDVGDTTGPGLAMVEGAGVRFPVGTDPDSSLAAGEFQLIGMPDTVFVSGRGVVTDVVQGAVSDQQLAVGISGLR